MKAAVPRAWLAVLVVAGTACSRAEISDVTPGAASVGAAQVWVTLTFKELPKEGDPTDVQLLIDSKVMSEQLVLTWADIAEKDVVALGDFKGNAPNTETTPEEPPPLNTPIKFRLSIPYKEEVVVGERDDLKLHLRLEWAGKHEHSVKEPIGHLYKRGPAGSR